MTTIEELPAQFAAIVEEFGTYLRTVENRSEHTVRAYTGDVAGLLAQLDRLGHTDLRRLDIAVLRGWLAGLRAACAAESDRRFPDSVSILISAALGVLAVALGALAGWGFQGRNAPGQGRGDDGRDDRPRDARAHGDRAAADRHT